MHRHDHKEREPKAFPQYDDAAHIDSAAVAFLEECVVCIECIWDEIGFG